MSLTSKFGYLVRQHLGNNATSAGPVTSLLKSNLMRCMATKLFVGGLSFGTDDQTLRDAFTSFGEVTEARVITDRDTGRSRGFGFVNFTTDESANEALSNMDGKELHGRHIRVSFATERAGGGGGFQGRYSGGVSFSRDPSS